MSGSHRNPRLDAMLGGRGFFRGSSICSRNPRTGKTIVASNFAHAAAVRGERTLYFSFEESPNQIIRNLTSIGLQLEPLVKKGLLKFHSARPSLYGLEMHLATMFKEIETFKPRVVVIDPITSLMDAGTDAESKGMVTRLIDYLKADRSPPSSTSLTQGGHALQQSRKPSRCPPRGDARGSPVNTAAGADCGANQSAARSDRCSRACPAARHPGRVPAERSAHGASLCCSACPPCVKTGEEGW